MRSPFPGMDPYIEGPEWPDFHTKLIGDVERTLASRLPPRRYRIELSKRSVIELVGQEGREEHSFTPDVKVTAPRTAIDSASGGTALAELAVAQAIPLDVVMTQEFEETFLEIRELADDRALITSLEVLSPSTKRPGGYGWLNYLRKREAVLFAKANLVEIDLLRNGRRMPMRAPWPDSPYTLLVCRGLSAPASYVWRGHYRHPLPAIPIPLRSPDPDVMLDLQTIIEEVYARSSYDELFNYTKPLDLPLPDDDAAWLAETLASRNPQP